MSGFGIVDSGALENDAGLQTLAGSAAANNIPEEDFNHAKQLWALFQKAKRWKLRCGAENWARYRDFWEGKQWQRQRPPGLSQAVINIIVETVETQVGHITDDIPPMLAHARNPAQVDIAQMVTKLIDWTDDLNHTDVNLEKPVRSCAITGFGVRRIDYDTTMDGRRGAVRLSYVDEDEFFTSPWARETDLSDASFVIHGRNIPIDFVRKTWEKGYLVPPGTWDGSLTPMRNTGGGADSGYSAFTTTDGSATQLTKPKSAEDKNRDLVTLLEFWIRQDDGTLRYTVCANGIILQDDLSPYDDDRYPFAIYNFIPARASVYGYGIVQFIERLQTMLNESASYELDQQRYESDSPLVVHQANIVEGKRLDNLPGKVLTDRTPDGRGYYVLNRQGAGNRWPDIEERFLQRIRDISGNVDILRGERPAGVDTLGAMEIVRDEANVLIGKIVKHVIAARIDEAILTVNRLRQFFKDPRVVRITGTGNQQEYIEANKPVGFKPDGELVLANTIPPDFEADITFSPEAPGGMQAKLERDLALLQAGVVDPQFVLEDLDFDRSRVDEMLTRMQEQQQAAMQAEAAAKNPQAAAQMQQQNMDPEAMADQVQQMMAGMAA